MRNFNIPILIIFMYVNYYYNKAEKLCVLVQTLILQQRDLTTLNLHSFRFEIYTIIIFKVGNVNSTIYDTFKIYINCERKDDIFRVKKSKWSNT